MRKQLTVSQARAKLKAQLDAGLISADEHRRFNNKISEIQANTHRYGNTMSWSHKRELYAIYAGYTDED